jgi:23S rRNA (guanine745-N1)-methyltransferase
MAIPGENHLFGLKRHLYEKPYKNTVSDTDLSGFSLLSEETISYKIRLDTPESISSLFMMTPYAYRTPREAAERLRALDILETEIEFLLFTYEKI